MTKIANGLMLALMLTVTPAYAKVTNQSIQHTSVDCMAQNVFHEAGGESELGQKAVASVTMNRVLSSKYPKTVCGVVYQRGQFSWVGKKKTKKIPGAIIKLAKIYTTEYTKAHDVTHGSTHFNSSKRSRWALPKTVKIGRHQFFKDNSRIVYQEKTSGPTIANK